MISSFTSIVKKLANFTGLTIFLVIYGAAFYFYFFSNMPFSIKNIIAFNHDKTGPGLPFYYSPETAYEAYYKTGIPDLQFFNSGKDIYDKFVKMGRFGRKDYERILLADTIYPAIYGFFYAIIIALIYKKAFPGNPAIHEICILPLIATLFDYMENAAIIQMLIAFPGKFRSIGSLPGYFTLFKHIFLMLSELVIVAGIAILIYKKLFARNPLAKQIELEG